VSALARRYGVGRGTARKWKRRANTTERPHEEHPRAHISVRARATEDRGAVARKKGVRKYAPGFIPIDIKYLPRMPDKSWYAQHPELFIAPVMIQDHNQAEFDIRRKLARIYPSHSN
jgi:hypothetical protein